MLDELQIERYYSRADLHELYDLDIDRQLHDLPIPDKDPLLASLWPTHQDFVASYHEHDSLLENKPDEELTQDELNDAWTDYDSQNKNSASFAPPDYETMAETLKSAKSKVRSKQSVIKRKTSKIAKNFQAKKALSKKKERNDGPSNRL